MREWRGFLIQFSCIAGVIILAITPSPDRELKILAFMALSGALGANVTRAKVDAVLQSLGVNQTMLTGTESLRPPSMKKNQPPGGDMMGPTGMMIGCVLGGIIAYLFA